MKNNLFIFIITLMPSILYLTYRVIKGMVFVKKNQTISTTSWL